MSSNNFKDLEDLYIKERGSASEQTKININSNINLFGFISNIIELYVPKAGNVLKSLGSFSGNHDIKSNK